MFFICVELQTGSMNQVHQYGKRHLFFLVLETPTELNERGMENNDSLQKPVFVAQMDTP